jgi:hypothetical protein
MSELRDFINALSRYLPHNDLMLVQAGLELVSIKYARGEVDDRGVDAGARKLCKKIQAALGTKLADLQRDLGVAFMDWCVDSIKSIVVGKIGAVTPESIVSMFTAGEKEKGREEKGLGLL